MKLMMERHTLHSYSPKKIEFIANCVRGLGDPKLVGHDRWVVQFALAQATFDKKEVKKLKIEHPEWWAEFDPKNKK